MNLVIFNSACVCTYVFVMLSILQSQFPEKGIMKTERFEDNLLLLLFLSTIDHYRLLCEELQVGLITYNTEKEI